MKLVVQLSLVVPLLVNCGCASLRDYKKSHNQFLDDSTRKLNEPDTKEQMKTIYFSVMPNPSESVLLINYLGVSAFDYMQCKIDKFNARYPSSEFKNHNRKILCTDEGDDK